MAKTITTPDLRGVPIASVPHVEQYFGIWAMELDRFGAMLQGISRMDLAGHIAQRQSLQAAAGNANGNGGASYDVNESGVAVIEIVGALTKYGSSLSQGGSTQYARRQVRAASRDERVRAIAVKIDSPGGSVAGTKDLADDIAAANKVKPVGAYIEDLGASAAYWLASQAGTVAANAMALVGSIGTYGVIYDWSKCAEDEGIKTHVIKAGAFKGMGVPGSVVTEEHLAEYQRTVDGLNAFFVKAVAMGRGMPEERVASLADGRVHVAGEAKALGLIDEVCGFDEFIEKLAGPGQRAGSAIKQKGDSEIMSESNKPVAATFQEIKTACRGADEKFICKQLETEATGPDAIAAWMDEQNSRLEASQTAQAESVKAAEEAGKAKTEAKPAAGVDPLGTGTGKAKASAGGGDATERWNEAVAEKVKAGMGKSAAIRAVAVADPDLHNEYLDEANAGRKVLGR